MQTFEFQETTEIPIPLIRPVPKPNPELLTDNEIIGHWAWRTVNKKKNPNYWNGPQVPKGQMLP